MICKYATDTGRKWCDCPGMTCTEIECRNPTRLNAILPGNEGRNDGANFHTKYAPQDVGNRAAAEYVLVRSRFCCQSHCVDFDGGDGRVESTKPCRYASATDDPAALECRNPAATALVGNGALSLPCDSKRNLLPTDALRARADFCNADKCPLYAE